MPPLFSVILPIRYNRSFFRIFPQVQTHNRYKIKSMVDFVHLHVHSQYSILDGACKLTDMIEKAIADGMPGVAVTDHGNMFGIKEFHDEASKHKGFKPIIGCETYVARRSHKEKSELIDRKGD